jgi:polyhydroxybutyrate depolymerase
VKSLIPTILIVLLLGFTGMIYAQDETPEATEEATAEVTPEIAPEATIEPVEFPGPGAYTLRGNIGRFERVYRVYIPDSYAPANDPVPLLFVFHGAGGTGTNIASISGFTNLADQEGFIAIFPDGVNTIWDDGRPPDPNIGPVDDLRFVSIMLETLTRSLNIDHTRIYAAGYSAGGMFSYRLGCEMADYFAAVASVASTFPEYLVNNCDNTPPVPVLIIQGTDDPVIPWVGVRGGYLSAAASLDYWQTHNGCITVTDITPQADADSDDNTRILTQGRTDCENGADVLLYGIFFGGHTWPGHPIDAPFDLGSTSMDIDATQVIWDFFVAHPHG